MIGGNHMNGDLVGDDDLIIFQSSQMIINIGDFHRVISTSDNHVDDNSHQVYVYWYAFLSVWVLKESSHCMSAYHILMTEDCTVHFIPQDQILAYICILIQSSPWHSLCCPMVFEDCKQRYWGPLV